MKKPLISVVTPVYGVEPYIHQYLNSVLNQTYRNLEIICVNDGSPDSCGAILDEYAAKDSRLRILHKANSGYTEAVNTALDMVTGEYVGFVDPDDWVELDYYEDMLKIAARTSAEIVISNYFRDYPDKSEIMVNLRGIPECFDDKVSAFRFGFESDIYRGFKMFCCNKLFTAKFFICEQAGGYGFRMSKRSTGSDVELASECFLKAKKFAYTLKPHYHYRIRENSLVRATDFERRIGLNFALEAIFGKLAAESFPIEILNLVKRFHTYYSSQLAEFAYQIGDKKNLAFSKNEMRKHLTEYIESSRIYPDRLARIERILSLEV